MKISKGDKELRKYFRLLKPISRTDKFYSYFQRDLAFYYHL